MPPHLRLYDTSEYEGSPNPVFCAILKEWLDTAVERGSRGITTYRRAYSSLLACPLRFTHPIETKVLDGIGEGLAKRLTDTFAEYCAANGERMPEVPRPSKRVRPPPPDNAISADGIPVSNAAKRKKRNKEYVPGKGTGAYALLLALHDAQRDEERQLMLRKDELIDMAKQYCDTSFDVPVHAGTYYTAWNSMSTLIEKELVYARGHPKRYVLTEEGMKRAAAVRAVVEGLEGDEGGRVSSEPVLPRASVPVPAAVRVEMRETALEEDMRTMRERAAAAVERRDSGATPVLSSETGQWGSDSGDECAGRGNAAAKRRRRLGETYGNVDSVYYTERRQAGALQNPSHPPQPPWPRTNQNVIAPVQGLDPGPTPALHSPPLPAPPAMQSWDAVPPAQRLGEGNDTSAQSARGELQEAFKYTEVSCYAGGGRQPCPPIPPSQLPPPSGQSTRPRAVISGPSRVPSAIALDSPSPVSPPSCRPAAQASAPPERPTTSTIPAFTPTIIKSNAYTLHLVLDIREVRTPTDRDFISSTLASSSLPPLVRPLQIGDVCWVARETSTGREFVLDYIVERKRLDDLVASIKDGRFHEQKFRLKKSAVRNVVYVVEEVSSRLGQTLEGMRESIDTAIGSLQVVDGVFVKKTASLKESIEYLLQFTQALKEKYRDKDLYVIPGELVDTRDYRHLVMGLREKWEDREWVCGYELFQQVMTKSAAMTLKDLFVRMLMCTKGLGPEKALMVQRAFGTPKRMVEALCMGEKVVDRLERGVRGQGVVRRWRVPENVGRKVEEAWIGRGND